MALHMEKQLGSMRKAAGLKSCFLAEYMVKYPRRAEALFEA